MRKDAKARALKRGQDGDALLTLERYHELAVKACGVTDADLATAGETIKAAMHADKLTQWGRQEDWDVRLKAAQLVLNMRGVATQAGGGRGNTGDGRVTLNVVLPPWAAAPGGVPEVLDVTPRPATEDQRIPAGL